MTPDQLIRLRAFEQHLEALALGFAALRQQVTALVSEAEAGSQPVPSLPTQEESGYYGAFQVLSPEKAETSNAARPRRTRRSP